MLIALSVLVAVTALALAVTRNRLAAVAAIGWAVSNWLWARTLWRRDVATQTTQPERSTP